MTDGTPRGGGIPGDDGDDVLPCGEGAAKSGVGPLPWLWGRKWCLKGEVGRESLFLEPTLLLHKEEQSFCMPVRASAGREGVGQGTKPQDQAVEVDNVGRR